MDEINKMFGDFEEKKQRERREEETKSHATKMLRDDSVRVLVEIVSPVLRELSNIIQQKGHKSEIVEKDDEVEIRFTPSSTVQSSVLRFMYIGSGSISILQDINKHTETPVTETGRYASKVPSDVNREWIRSRVLAFIELVLKVN